MQGVDPKVDFLVSFLLQAVFAFKRFFCSGQLKNYAGNTGCGGWIDEVETSGIRGPYSLLWRIMLRYCPVMQVKLYCVGCWVSVLTLGISIYW